MEPLIATDIETDLIVALTAALPGVHVSDRVPQTRPAKYVRINRIGGNDSLLVQERPLVMVESWARAANGSSKLAGDLSREVAAHMRAMAGTFVNKSWVYEVVLTSPVNQPDPQTDDPRYTFTAQLRTRLKEMP